MTNYRQWKHLAMPILITITVVLVLFFQDSLSLAVLALMVGCLWLSIMIYRIKDKPLDYEIRAIGNRVLKESKSQSDNQELIKRSLGAIAERQITHQVVTSDTAGSVVRMSNAIKNIPAYSFSESEIDPNSISDVSRQKSIEDLTTGNAELTSRSYSFPTPSSTRKSPTYKGIRVVMIADEFTAEAFSDEWEVVQPKKENWFKAVKQHDPHFVFVESAWEAVGGSWKSQLVGSQAPRKEIKDLISYCKEKNIPTAFWNKEDPPHFEDFIKTAGLFDYVFTTEDQKIPEYQIRLGHKNVALLPFAAQPAIHNPARIEQSERDRAVMFAGMYFRDKYPERREQMDMILPSAAKHGLDIFSRQDGSDPKYRFPTGLAEYVRGSLPYHQVLGAYHAYKVVVNVNSVVNSRTMCARRIFEATASGAAVLTTHTEAVENFFPQGLLSVVSSEDDANHQIRALLRSDEYRERKVLKAQRHIWENHTYTHRAETVMSELGIPFESKSKNLELVTFFVSTNRPQNVENIFINVSRQSLPNKQLVFLTHGFQLTSEEVDDLSSKYSVSNVKTLYADSSQTLGANLNQLTAAADGEYLFRMDDDDFYGSNYSRDLLNILKVTNATLAGKSASYIYFEGLQSTVLTFPGKEHRFTDFVRGATFCGPKSTFSEFQFPELDRSEDSNFLTQIKKSGGKIYASDRFNFMVNRLEDKSSHTWTVDDYQLFATGDMKFVGSDPKQIEV